MNVLFRVDANPISGFGHFSRCLSLGRTWLSKYPQTTVSFVGNYTDFAIGLLNKYQISFQPVASTDFASLHNNLLMDADYAIFDSYFITQQHLGEMIRSNYQTLLIDDECKFDYTGIDAVVNFRFEAEKMYHYNASKQYLGKDYFLVKPEIAELRAKNKNKLKHPLNNVLLFFGGGFSDVQFLAALIRHLNQEVPHVKPSLICSAPLIQDEHLHYQYIQPSFNIENFLSETDLVINGGGLIKYEATFALIPTATISTTLLQYEDSLVLEQLGLHQNAGFIEKDSFETIALQLNKILHEETYRTQLVHQCNKLYSDDPTTNLIAQLV